MPRASEHWTAERVRALPDDRNRYELIDGELVVTPAPRGSHQLAVRALVRRLDPWLRDTGIAELLWSPADLALGDDEILQPDLFVYQIASGKLLHDWSDISALLLVIEIVSPSTARYDRRLKRRRYQRARIPDYWVVDLDARLIERWRPDDVRPEILTERMAWEPVSERGILEIDVAAFFGEVLGR